MIAGEDSGVIGTAWLDNEDNGAQENNTTTSDAGSLGVFCDELVTYYNVGYSNSTLPTAPVGPNDLPALKAILYGSASPGGRYEEIRRVADGLARTLAAVAAHEIGHSLGLTHTSPSSTGFADERQHDDRPRRDVRVHGVGLVEAALTLPADLDGLWAALPWCDLLQAGAARLLLWSDSQPLPRIGAKDAAWDCYLRIWRPGKPSRMRWDAAYDGAVEVCREGTALDVSEPTDPAAILDHIEHSRSALRRAIA